jgi:hypothetical protein
MADIFVSYTKSDRDWVFWLAAELKQLGHTPTSTNGNSKAASISGTNG